MTAFLTFAFLLIFSTLSLAAEPKFPELTGRVVDTAHHLSSYTKRQIDNQLENFEHKTGDQIVVVMLPDLQGFAIEDYGYKLGRHWGIGQKGKDNGALLIVVPSEHKVRIEVGYGLEGVLTDAASSQVINTVMTPLFKQGKIGDGVLAGVQAIIMVLGGHDISTLQPVPPPPPPPAAQQQNDDIPGWVIFVIFIVLMFMGVRYPSFAWWLLMNVLSSSYRGGSSRIGGGGGGFKGGGGSFGGGGSSGSW